LTRHDPGPDGPSAVKKDMEAVAQPIDLVKLSLGENVHIKCKGNRDIFGKLHAFDQHLNLVLEHVDETLSYLETNGETLEETVKVIKKQYELLYIRGDAVILIAPLLK
jgi:U6 snRNA-associated Sm-like protein LSm3